MPEGEDGPMPGFIDFVEVGVAFRLPADGSADDGDGDISDPTDKPRLETTHLLLAARYRACIRSCSCTEKETYTDFADLTCEIRDIRGSLFSRSAAISPLFFRWRTPRSSTIQKREASAMTCSCEGKPIELPIFSGAT